MSKPCGGAGHGERADEGAAPTHCTCRKYVTMSYRQVSHPIPRKEPGMATCGYLRSLVHGAAAALPCTLPSNYPIGPSLTSMRR